MYIIIMGIGKKAAVDIYADAVAKNHTMQGFGMEIVKETNPLTGIYEPTYTLQALDYILFFMEVFIQII